ncbi:MAG: hypothetical protein H0W49_10885 [Nitrospirales bacterium]|nr:hypothetical protein [Nitrospirales bacterium]
MLILTASIIVVLWSDSSGADLADKLDDLVGYTIVAEKTIVGWYDDNEHEEGSFNGCSYERVILFQDNTGLTCAEYGYMYAYRPKAIILAKQSKIGEHAYYDIKMVVGDEIYDMRKIKTVKQT